MRPLAYGVAGDYHLEDQTVSLVKIIVITIAVILSILFFGRFLF